MFQPAFPPPGRKLTGVPAFLMLSAGVALIPQAATPRGEAQHLGQRVGTKSSVSKEGGR